MKNYIVPEDVLVNLIQSSLKLDALEIAGVNNWDWYYDALGHFFDDSLLELESLMEPVAEPWFDDLARATLKKLLNEGEIHEN